MSLFIKFLFFIFLTFSQSEFGSIFSVMDSVPSMINQTIPLKNVVSFLYKDHFGLENTTEFSGLISFKEYNSILSIKNFDIGVFRESESQISSFYSIKNITFGSEICYRNQWYKGIKSVNSVSLSPSLEFNSFFKFYITLNELIDSHNEKKSTTFIAGKKIKNSYIEVYFNRNLNHTFHRITFSQKVDALKIYLGFQNGTNEFLSGLEFYSNLFLFRFSYELYHELGSRSQIGLSYFY